MNILISIMSTCILITGCSNLIEVKDKPKHTNIALASYYGGGPKKFEPNLHTANGERFIPDGYTLAHRSLPFGTKVHITYKDKSVICRVNDRGPALWTKRSLDLSRGCAKAIGMTGVGIAHVKYAILP